DTDGAPEVPAQPEVLPAVSPEEQYRFALGRALQNDLETAQLAFSEFRKFNKGHAREADSIFWLGRVYFMRGEYEKAAMTFSEFNSAFPGDARLVDTTMWIAESVSHFAPPAQACEIYASLPQLIDTPPDTFLAQLSKLSDDANCPN
ncbi:MAG: tetratricopeptide repeat protein, partial [Candidatus Puniceispirillaceae bacterium]